MNLRSIKKHCRAFISGVGYPDSGFYYVSLAVWRMDRGWVEGGKPGRRCVVPRMRGDDGLDLGSGCKMQRHGWVTYEYLEKGTGEGPCRPVTWAQLTLGL